MHYPTQYVTCSFIRVLSLRIQLLLKCLYLVTVVYTVDSTAGIQDNDRHGDTMASVFAEANDMPDDNDDDGDLSDPFKAGGSESLHGVAEPATEVGIRLYYTLLYLFHVYFAALTSVHWCVSAYNCVLQ